MADDEASPIRVVERHGGWWVTDDREGGVLMGPFRTEADARSVADAGPGGD